MSFTAVDVVRQAPHHLEERNRFIYRLTERVLAWMADGYDCSTVLDWLFPRLTVRYRERVELSAAMACVFAERELRDWELAGMNLSVTGLFDPNPLERALRQCVAWQDE